MIFEKKRYRTQNVCLDFLYNFCLKRFSFCEEFSGISTMYKGPRVKYPLFLSDFNKNLNLLYGFSEIPQIQTFTKILPVGAEVFHADGWTDSHDEANSRFSQFCERA